MKEKWIDIKGYEGLYQVSNMGNVKSLDRKIIRGGFPASIPGRILKPGLVGRKRKQYLGVVLCRNSKMYPITIHRLVGKHFIPNPKNLTHLNHKDHNSLNNLYTNLKWTTNRENIAHGKRSKYPGSIKQKPSGYTSQLHFKGKTYYLGFFKTAKQASDVYKKAVKQLTGVSF